MYPRFFQGIFGLLALASASANVEKRTVADGTGDAAHVGSHFGFGYNGRFYLNIYAVVNLILTSLMTPGLTGPLYWGKFNAQCGGHIQSPINSMKTAFIESA